MVFFFIKICIHVHANIPYSLVCETALFVGQWFTVHQSSMLWSVSENPDSFLTLWDIWRTYLF